MPRFRLAPEIAAALQEISRLDHDLNRYILRAADYLAIVEEAWADNFHASTSLEGNPMTLPEVRRLTSRALGASQEGSGGDPFAQEILNHLFVWLLPDALAMPWTTPFIQEVHRLLLRGVDPLARPGTFSRGQMTVTDPSGEVLFYGAPATSLVAELEDLMLWANNQAPAFHPVVAAAIVFHEFESIHPFADGNGRVGRVLFHAYLQNAGLKNAHLCLIEQALVADSDLYYRILAWTDDRGDYSELIAYVTEAVLDSYRQARDRLESKDLVSKGMDEHRRVLLVEAKRRRDWFSAREATRWTDGIGHTAVLRHLNALAQADVLEAAGATKSKRFRFKSPFHAIELLQADRLEEMRRRFLDSKDARPAGPGPRKEAL